MNKKQKGRYRKTSPGEQLVYQSADLKHYSGEQFCLRITLDDMDLDTCFFVYLDEAFETTTIRQFFQDYFIHPSDEQIAQMTSWIEPLKYIDPQLENKYVLLRQMFARASKSEGRVYYYINHGPRLFVLNHPVLSHLGTSVFDDGSFDDKILDIVLEFRVKGTIPGERSQWQSFGLIHETSANVPEHQPLPHEIVPNRRNLLWLLTLIPTLFCCVPFTCRKSNNNRYTEGQDSGRFGNDKGAVRFSQYDAETSTRYTAEPSPRNPIDNAPTSQVPRTRESQQTATAETTFQEGGTSILPPGNSTNRISSNSSRKTVSILPQRSISARQSSYSSGSRSGSSGFSGGAL